MSKVITMIPVRLAATRLPNKPLLDINGKTLIQRVYENVKAAIDGDVCIACGDEKLWKKPKIRSSVRFNRSESAFRHGQNRHGFKTD